MTESDGVRSAVRETRTVRLPRALRDRITAAARAAYPIEACGILVGERRSAPAQVRVREALPTENVADGDRRRRFAIAPEVLLRVQNDARADGLEIVGYYHSHPDSPALPSAADRAAAWPDVSYLIAAVAGDEPGELRSWRLDPASGRFVEERVELERG